MRAHIDAIKAMLAPSGRQVYYGEVPDAPTYPYVLLWSTTGRVVADRVCGTQDTLNDLVGVTVAGKTAESVLEVSKATRALLMDKRPVVAGRSVQPLRLHDAREVQIDRDVILPGTNRHPSFGVDMYRLISEPA